MRKSPTVFSNASKCFVSIYEEAQTIFTLLLHLVPDPTPRGKYWKILEQNRTLCKTLYEALAAQQARRIATTKDMYSLPQVAEPSIAVDLYSIKIRLIEMFQAIATEKLELQASSAARVKRYHSKSRKGSSIPYICFCSMLMKIKAA